MKHKKIFTVIIAVLVSGYFNTVIAGTYTDDLSKCLVNNTSEEDRIDFLKWMFFAMAQHPELKAHQNITEEQQQAIDKKLGKTFSRLIAKDCSKELKLAQQYEPSTYMQSFEVFGRVAMTDLMSDPSVQKGLSSLSSYVDEDLKK